MTAHQKKVKNWKAILRKLRDQREKRMKVEEEAARRERESYKKQEEKYRNEEREFRLLLKRDAARTRQMIKQYLSKLVGLEKKLDRIITKNKLKN